MSTSTDPVSREPSTKNPHHDVVDMRPTRFDLTSGFFLTLILFLGVIVSLMFLLWTVNRWASQSEIHHSPPVRTTFVDAGERGSEGNFDIPSAYEVQELTASSVQESLISVTTSANKTAHSLEELGDFSQTNSRFGHFGPDAGRGIPDAEFDIVPRFERWQLNFTASDRASYAAQLDHFKMELGVVGGGIQGLDIVAHLSTDPHSHRLLDTTKEKRLYFMWTTPNRFSEFEHTMLKQAAIELNDRLVVRLIPQDLENELAVAELEFAKEAGHESVTEIAKTVFQSVRVGDGFGFQVVDQRYR